MRLKKVFAWLLAGMLASAPALANEMSNATWSESDSSNNSASPNGWTPGTMLPNQVEPTAQAMMGALKRWWDRSNFVVTTTGTAPHYVYTPANASFPTGYVQGEKFCAKADKVSSGNDDFNVSGLGAKPLYKTQGAVETAIGAGDIPAASIFCAIYDSALNSGNGGFHVFGEVGLGPTGLGHGQVYFGYTSATQVTLNPKNGSGIQIKGVLYAVPTGGIAGHNTSTYVCGVAAQNLVANGVYYVYVFNNAGTLTLDFCGTGHVTDSTAGNVGVEVKNGDNSRTLVGFVYVNGSAQFVQNAANAQVRSWFNRDKPTLYGSVIQGSVGTSASYTLLNGNLTVSALIWSGEAFDYDFVCSLTSPTLGAGITLSPGLDGTPVLGIPYHVAVATYWQGCSTHYSAPLAEGYHVISEYYVSSPGWNVTADAFGAVR